MLPAMQPPGDLCAAHELIWKIWSVYRYDPNHPKEWGGGPLMDNRTSHADRERNWDEKTLKELGWIEKTCRSGVSPQCTKER